MTSVLSYRIVDQFIAAAVFYRNKNVFSLALKLSFKKKKKIFHIHLASVFATVSGHVTPSVSTPQTLPHIPHS